jgi:hypothetical protein
MLGKSKQALRISVNFEMSPGRKQYSILENNAVYFPYFSTFSFKDFERVVTPLLDSLDSVSKQIFRTLAVEYYSEKTKEFSDTKVSF